MKIGWACTLHGKQWRDISLYYSVRLAAHRIEIRSHNKTLNTPHTAIAADVIRSIHCIDASHIISGFRATAIGTAIANGDLNAGDSGSR